MGRGKPLTCVSYISIDDAEPVLFSSLTEEQKSDVFKDWSKRLSETMSRYYQQHPGEFERLKE